MRIIGYIVFKIIFCIPYSLDSFQIYPNSDNRKERQKPKASRPKCFPMTTFCTWHSRVGLLHHSFTFFIHCFKYQNIKKIMINNIIYLWNFCIKPYMTIKYTNFLKTKITNWKLIYSLRIFQKSKSYTMSCKRNFEWFKTCAPSCEIIKIHNKNEHILCMFH